MPGLRERLFEPSARYDVDLASRRALLGGVFQAWLHLLGFSALFGLAVVLEVAPLEAWNEPPAAFAFWAALLGGGIVGVGLVALATVERVDRIWRTPAGRAFTVIAIYVAFWMLLVTAPPYAIFAGLAFVIGRVIAHGWRVHTART